jgi:tripartite ATP-independent transporter DctM subunit
MERKAIPWVRVRLYGRLLTMGLIIPPSIPMLLFASLASESVGKLFLGGLIRGWHRRYPVPDRYRYANGPTCRWKKWSTTRRMSCVRSGRHFGHHHADRVIGAIVGGVCTATEAAGIGALYALLVGAFVYRTLNVRTVWKIVKQTAMTSATIMIIIAFSCMFTWILTLEGVTGQILSLFAVMNLSKTAVMLVCGLIILLAGCFLDVSPVIMLFTPVLLPVVTMAGGSAVQLGALMIVGTAIGLVTPPVGMCLNVASTISKKNILFIFRSATPFLIANLVVMILICALPAVSEWLPGLFA